MLCIKYTLLITVHCRTGSLETDLSVGLVDADVHCRTGSLER